MSEDASTISEPRTAREIAWDTRRAKYGEAGHAGYRRRRALLDRRALALIVRMHVEQVLSEGQCCAALDLDRVEFRALCDEFTAVGETVGEKIMIARRSADLTQQELADRAGVTRPQIANIEGGRSDIPTKTLMRIAEALGCRPGDLFP